MDMLCKCVVYLIQTHVECLQAGYNTLGMGRKLTAWTKGAGITWNDGMKWISKMMVPRSGHDLQVCGLFNQNACGFLPWNHMGVHGMMMFVGVNMAERFS